MRRALHAALSTFLAAGLLLAGQQANAAPDADAPASTFTSRSPVRVLDTRTGTGAGGSTSPVGAGGTITVDLAAEVPASATAVVLNVTGVTPTAATYVTVFPSGTSRPNASSLNLTAGDTKPNQVTVALGADRRISLYNNNGNVHLVADIAGHYATGAGAKFTALPQGRLLDTRSAGGPVGPGATKVVDLTDRVPASATAVTFNLTATNPTAATFVTAWPTGTTRPNASNLNVVAGETRPNLVTVAIGADRNVSLYNNAGQTDLIVDLSGFYTPDCGASFIARPPTRVLDTRNGTGGTTGPVGAGTKIALDLAGLALTATGVVLNVTGVDATASTYVTVWGRYGGQPNASVLNLSPGQTAPNAATVAFHNQRAIELYNNNGNVHLVADLAGVFIVTEPSCVDDCGYAWGANSLDRSLGTAEAVFSSWTPTPVVGLSGVRAIDGGSSENGYALRTDGTVWAWGNNEGGQLGNGWTSTWSGGYGGGSKVPVPVQGLTGITAIAGSGYGAYALRSDGTVWAWGADSAGQLGTGGTADHTSTPVRIGLTNVVAIAGGWNTGYAVRFDGMVWAWGFNGNGNLGNGSTVEYASTPVQVPGLTGVTAIAAQDHGAYVLRSDGTVWAWGYNGAGQLGNGQPCDPNQCVSRVPVQVSGLTGVTAIGGSVNNGFAVRNDGSVWSWGANYQGSLGNGVECDPAHEICESRVPVQVSNLDDVTKVAGFAFGGYALRADGTVWAWGANMSYALGTTEVSGRSAVPVPVVGVSGVSDIGAGWESGFALVP